MVSRIFTVAFIRDGVNVWVSPISSSTVVGMSTICCAGKSLSVSMSRPTMPLTSSALAVP